MPRVFGVFQTQMEPDKYIFIFHRLTVVLLLQKGVYPEIRICFVLSNYLSFSPYVLYCQITFPFHHMFCIVKLPFLFTICFVLSNYLSFSPYVLYCQITFPFHHMFCIVKLPFLFTICFVLSNYLSFSPPMCLDLVLECYKSLLFQIFPAHHLNTLSGQL